MGKDGGCKTGAWLYYGSKIGINPGKQIRNLYVNQLYEKSNPKLPDAGNQRPAYKNPSVQQSD
jgi:hypothetical protein